MFFLAISGFKKIIIGRVSFLNSTQCTTKVIEEQDILREDLVKVVLPYVRSYLLKAYKKINTDNLDDSVYKNSIFSLMIMGWKSMYPRAFAKIMKVKKDNNIKYTFGTKVVQWLTRDNLHLYLHKHPKMLSIIESNEDMEAIELCKEIKRTGLFTMSCTFQLLGY